METVQAEGWHGHAGGETGRAAIRRLRWCASGQESPSRRLPRHWAQSPTICIASCQTSSRTARFGATARAGTRPTRTSRVGAPAPVADVPPHTLLDQAQALDRLGLFTQLGDGRIDPPA